ncbi:MAG: GSCFA domain-containing protein [Chitinophagales bacterium]|nr:GSCFA domain-containing protein [Chitinophagales bacterium]
MSIQLQLQVHIPQFPFQLTHQNRIMMIGSCFSENMSQVMLQNGFHVQANPWGILYNPISIAHLVNTLENPGLELPLLPILRDKRWFSLHQHSDISSESKEGLKNEVFRVANESRSFYEQSDILIITLGTAFVYEYIEANHTIVGNCQKLPLSKFNKRILSVNEIVDCWSDFIQRMSNKKIIFTVSPVRHYRDGLIENNRSKSTLLLAVHRLVELYPESCFYFPSYEIVIDELRDYRFFKEDMAHPSTLAINYIWEKWKGAFFDLNTVNKATGFNKLFLFSRHKPSVNNEAQYFRQLKELYDKTQLQFPGLNYQLFDRN